MKMSTMILVICCIFGILAIIVSVMGFKRMNQATLVKTKVQKVLSSLLCALMIVVLAANGACYYFESVISTYFTYSTVAEEEIAPIIENTQNVVEEVENEGIVLLENKNSALPLDVAAESKINIFGQASVNPCFGGAGSGEGNVENDTGLVEGLLNAGFTVNESLIDFYEEHKGTSKAESKLRMTGGDYTMIEPDVTEFSNELLSEARDFSDIALVILSRNGGEGGDLPLDMGDINGDSGRHYLELSSSEEALFEMVDGLGFEKVIVVVNSSNAMELGFLEQENVDAAVWIGGPGATGFNSLGNVLAGLVNPSGRTVDTYAYDLTTSPAYYNCAGYLYTNAPELSVTLASGNTRDTPYAYVNYEEGIYVGYRYYETRWVDNQSGDCDEETYQEMVQYPFGYGLSYTSFEQEISDFTDDGDKISMDVIVTNTGDVAGKDVVQVYYSSPYYEGGIEKSNVVLAGFDKTDEIEPGDSQTVTISFTHEDMASYDYSGIKAKGGAYVLEAGEYKINLQSNAHDVIDSRSVEIGKDYIFNDDNDGARATDLTTAENQFDAVSFGTGLVYVSRADWEGTLPTESADGADAPQEVLDVITQIIVEDNPDDKEIIFADHGLKLSDMKGLDHDDPLWDDLLEQLSVEDMARLVGMGGYITVEIDSIDKKQTAESEGPAGLNSFMNGISGTHTQSEAVLASTWNIDLAQKLGEAVSSEAYYNGNDGMMCPAMNIHRTPFGGRNFEYYSEDGYLSGMIAAGYIKGMTENGVITFCKHFALNDEETYRYGICVWANEQAMRELYFKPFELAVKVGETSGIMSSFNRLGVTWAGGSYPLLTTVLREEWGFVGTVISDMANVYAHMEADVAIRAGNDLMLAPTTRMPSDKTTGTNTGHQALRNASHNILYTVVNSNALEVTDRQKTHNWPILIVAVDVVALLVAAGGFCLLSRKKEQQPK